MLFVLNCKQINLILVFRKYLNYIVTRKISCESHVQAMCNPLKQDIFQNIEVKRMEQYENIIRFVW